MGRYKFKKLKMGIILINSSVFKDNRGSFLEIYDKKEFEKAGIKCNFIQSMISISKSGVMRGLHFQDSKYSQAKLVRCLSGKVWEVAVDVRKNSKTFGQYVAVELSGKNMAAIFVPRGFALGFVVLSKENAILLYNVDNDYSPIHASGVRWNDKNINIRWPITPKIISEKDRNLKELNYL